MTTTSYRTEVDEARHKRDESSLTGKEVPSGLWSLMRPVRGKINSAIVLAAISAVLEVVVWGSVPFILAELLAGTPNQTYIWLLTLTAGVLVVLAFAVRIWAFRLSHFAAFRLEEHLRIRLFEHLARAPSGYVVVTGSGALKKIIQDDVRALHALVADSIPALSRSLATPLLTILLLFIVDWRMALITLAILPFGLYSLSLAMKDSPEMREKYFKANEDINAAVIEFVQGMQVVRIFDDGSTSSKRYHRTLYHFTQHLEAWQAATDKPKRLANLILGSSPIIFVVAVAGSWLLLQGALTFPVLLIFLLLATGITASFVPIMWLIYFINMSRVAAMRICQIFTTPVLPQSEHPQFPRDSTICFRDVTFTYPERTRPALDHIHLTIPAGTVTALVGPSGAGKTTIAQLIPRFWDVQQGSIEIGGVDIRQMTSETLMQQVAFVFQHPFLLHDTILENIRLGRPGATTEEIERAARVAQAHDFICALPEGYQTLVGERGTSLSGGQSQRITIARAILQDCSIIVLDEATAFADPENEAQIQAALAHLTAGKTLILIAHRLSTVQYADQIIVLDSGRIIEQGKHEELVRLNGLYARLWTNHQRASQWTLPTPSMVVHQEEADTRND